jgi:hypothetical protein
MNTRRLVGISGFPLKNGAVTAKAPTPRTDRRARPKRRRDSQDWPRRFLARTRRGLDVPRTYARGTVDRRFTAPCCLFPRMPCRPICRVFAKSRHVQSLSCPHTTHEEAVGQHRIAVQRTAPRDMPGFREIPACSANADARQESRSPVLTQHTRKRWASTASRLNARPLDMPGFREIPACAASAGRSPRHSHFCSSRTTQRGSDDPRSAAAMSLFNAGHVRRFRTHPVVRGACISQAALPRRSKDHNLREKAGCFRAIPHEAESHLRAFTGSPHHAITSPSPPHPFTLTPTGRGACIFVGWRPPPPLGRPRHTHTAPRVVQLSSALPGASLARSNNRQPRPRRK